MLLLKHILSYHPTRIILETQTNPEINAHLKNIKLQTKQKKKKTTKKFNNIQNNTHIKLL